LLSLGFLFFGKEGLNLQVVLGMVVAVLGMIWYGNASAKPGGKERRSILPVRSDKHKGDSEEKVAAEKVYLTEAEIGDFPESISGDASITSPYQKKDVSQFTVAGRLNVCQLNYLGLKTQHSYSYRHTVEPHFLALHTFASTRQFSFFSLSNIPV
jgi:hypothetical protein